MAGSSANLWATDYNITAPRGALTLDDGDTATITSTGSVTGTTRGLQEPSLFAVNRDVAIDNAGTLEVTSPSNSSSALYFGNATITNLTNSGTIKTNTSGGYGIVAKTINVFNNSGTISSYNRAVDTRGSGVSAPSSFINQTGASITSTNHTAIDLNGSNIAGTLINDGTIQGSADYFGLLIEGPYGSVINNENGVISGGRAIDVNGGITTFVNSGRITGTSTNLGVSAIQVGGDMTSFTNNASGTIESNMGRGVVLRSATTFLNAGNITASYEAVFIDNKVAIENTGTIKGSSGIWLSNNVNGDLTVTNSGTIESTAGGSGTAIYFGGTGVNTLKIEAGSNIIGKIDWDGTDDVAEFAAGTSSSLTFTNLPDTLEIATVLSDVVKNTVVQADTSTVNIVDDAVGDVAAAASSRISSRAGSVFQNPVDGGEGDGGQNPEEIEGFGYGVMSDYADRNAWVSVWGAASFQETTSTLADTTAYSGGVLGGIDWSYSNDTLLGLHGGGGLGKVTVNVTDGQQTDTRSLFGGVMVVNIKTRSQ